MLRQSLTLAAVLLCLSACGAAEQEDSAPVTQPAAPPSEQPTGKPLPVVPLSDPTEFDRLIVLPTVKTETPKALAKRVAEELGEDIRSARLLATASTTGRVLLAFEPVAPPRTAVEQAALVAAVAALPDVAEVFGDAVSEPR